MAFISDWVEVRGITRKPETNSFAWSNIWGFQVRQRTGWKRERPGKPAFIALTFSF